MSAFTLDTSGEVRRYVAPRDYDSGADNYLSWSDLDAFTQGYVEALFASLVPERVVNPPFGGGFSDLSPEALAAILADCAAFNVKIGDASHNRGIGAAFWKARQAGFNAHWSLHQADLVSAFPPLTVSLADDGKVHLPTIERTETQ